MDKGLKANLAPNVFASIGCIRHAQTFQILVIAQPYERGARNQDIFAHGVEGCDGHAMGKKAPKNRMHADVVSVPFNGQRACEAEHGPVGGVVSDRFCASIASLYVELP